MGESNPTEGGDGCNTIWMRVMTGAALGLLLVLAGAGPAWADTDLEITTPADGRYQPGQQTPLLVTLTAPDGAISGTITVNFEGQLAGSERVEVPGGSTKEFVMIVSTPPWGAAGSVRFDADGSSADDVEARLGLTANREDELVAVFDDLGAADIPATADLDVDLGQARLYRFDPALLAEGPDVLSVFSQVVVTSSDLNQLGPDGVAVLEAWVGGSGGTLVVDEDPATSLPLSFDSSSDGAGLAVGTGRIVFTDGRIAESGFDGALAPTPSRSTDEFPWSSGFGGAPTSMTLVQDAGITLPSIRVLLLVLFAYVILAGPLLWVLLRRSNREPLQWLLLPALALLTTGGVYVAGLALREDANSAHATVIADLPNMQSVSTQVLVTSPNGGREGIQLDDGWVPVSTIGEEEWFAEGPFGGVDRSNSPPVQVGDDLVTELPPGGIRVLSATTSSITDTDPSWAVDLAEVDGKLQGTITNLTPHTLEEVFVSAGAGYDNASAVEPGESVEITLSNHHLPPTSNDRFMESLWQFDPWGPNQRNSSVNIGALMNWLSRNPSVRTPGFILVGGWTNAEQGPLRTAGGRQVTNGRTAFLTVTTADGATGGEPYRLELLRGWNSTQVTDRPGNECAEFSVTLRMLVADPGGIGSDPVLDLSKRGVAAFDLWDGQEWIPAGMADTSADRVVVAVPPGAVADDQLYLRMNLSCEFWGFANPFPDLRPATAEDEVYALGALGDDPISAPAASGDARRSTEESSEESAPMAETIETLPTPPPPEAAMPSDEVIVTTRGLTKQYGKLKALDHLDLDVPKGSVFGIIGPNGAGKSTTFAILATLLRPTAGTALVCGADPTGHPKGVRRKLGYMPDVMGVYDRLRVDEYLEFHAAAYGVARAEWPELIDGLLELVDLDVKRDAMVDSLSRGMKQRLSLARAMVHDPDLLILDEPASGLDPRARIEFRLLLLELQRLGKTILISSHILAELQQMCTDIAVLEAGKLLASGTPDAIIEQLGGGRRVTVRFLDGTTAEYPVADEAEQAALLRRLIGEGRDIVEFSVAAHDLEALFLQITEGVVQ